jgi:surfactin synthase thioesterase subunit
MKRLKLFCIPYSGGLATTYFKWKRYFNDFIELVPIELAGHGKRLKESFYKDMSDAVDDISEIIKPEITDSNYALFGHSLGGYIAYEAANRMMVDFQATPLHLFVSGCNPPQIHCKRYDKKIHLLPDSEFIQKIIDFGGFPEEVLQDEEVMAFFMPVLRSDYKLFETYHTMITDQKSNCDISIFLGKNDAIIYQDAISAWIPLSHQKCHFNWFSGGHFFINEHVKEITYIISTILAE